MRFSSEGPAAVACSALLISILLLNMRASLTADAVAAGPLLRRVGFTPGEIATIQRGDPVARFLDTDRREIAVIGAVRIRAPLEKLAERLGTLEYMRANRMVLNVGAFSIPPRPSDLNVLPFEAYDLDVRDCRPGDCRVRLSAEDMTRFQREVEWGSSVWQMQSAQVWRQLLAGYAEGYMRSGSSRLPLFANKKDLLSVAAETELLWRQSSVTDLVPALTADLQKPAPGGVAAGDQMLFWSKEDFGIRPVMRVTHQAVHRVKPSANEPAPPLVIASTQIYASHYLDASLGFIIALQRPSPDGTPAFDMVAINRARTRSLTGILRTMIRSTVQGRCRDAMEGVLRTTKSSLESNRQNR